MMCDARINGEGGPRPEAMIARLVVLAWLLLAPFPAAAQTRQTVAPAQPVRLSSTTPRLQTPPVTVDPETATLTVRLRRPTTAAPLAWDAVSAVRVALVVVVDGVEYRAVGQASGGVRTKPDGTEAAEYVLAYQPPVVFGARARAFTAASTPDASGAYRDVPLTRIGETATQSIQAYVLLERLRGSVETEVLAAEAVVEPAPTIRHKNSVAFDAASSAKEENGDGTLSLSHANSGTDNLQAFAGVGKTFAVDSTSCTYGGTAMTELWDINDLPVTANEEYVNAGYHFPAGSSLPTGAQTVTSVVGGSNWDHILGVMTMTGVHQTAPVGTPVTAVGSGTTASVTVGSVGTDDLVVDNFYKAQTAAPTVGADQTQRWIQTAEWRNSVGAGSTQPGTAGGVMTWSLPSGLWLHGAVAFKPAAGGGAGCVACRMHHYRMMRGG